MILSDKGEVLLDFDAMVKSKYFNVDGEGFGVFYPEKDVKEFIKISKARIENQLRIHWLWLKKKNPEEVTEFILNIINKRAGNKLI